MLHFRFFFVLVICFLGLLPVCAQQKIMGTLSAPVLNEVSGIAASQQRKAVLYVHNDSGDSSRFFAIDTSGKLLATYFFTGIYKGRLTVLDCEDIAMGPGPLKQQQYIYLADIGDNFSVRPSVQVYRFKEPAATNKNSVTLKADVLQLVYPDGPHDAETILIDPKQKILYLITKREDSVNMYSCPLIFNHNDKVTLAHRGKILLQGKGSGKWIVAGSISADGNHILLKSLEKVFYWPRKGNEAVSISLQRQPVIQKKFTPHGQQEAISFTADGKGYYITAEGRQSNIYYYILEK
jgi:hypothetical protein